MRSLDLPAPFELAGAHIAIDLPGARALFTTRRGGYSHPPFESMNLGILTEDDPNAVRRNRSKLEDEHGFAPAWGLQVHAAHVQRRARPNDPDAEPVEADGQATSTPGVAPMVLGADCLTVAIAGGGAVAVVHAGWKGLAAGVLAEGVAAIGELGANGAMQAAIGPAAGPCCYEVGDELRERFAPYGPGVRRGRNLDLKAIATRQLRDAGVQTVHDVGLCTICAGEDLFFSHRRDRGVTGRQAAIAWLTA